MKITKFRIKRCGFTIMEMLLYMGLLMILLAVLSQLFAGTIESQLLSQSYSAVNQDGTYILNRLTYDIQRASSVTTPINIGDQTGTLTIVINGTSYTYSVTSGNLLVNGIQLNSYGTTVSGVTFQKLGNSGGKPTVKIAYTLTSKVVRQDSRYETNSYATTIGLR